MMTRPVCGLTRPGRPTPKPATPEGALSRGWAIPAGLAGGGAGALFGAGSPPYIMYLTRRLLDKGALDIVEFPGVRRRIRRFVCVAANAASRHGQMFAGDQSSLAQNHGALDRVLQLAHVAWPAIGEQTVSRIL